MAKFCTECGKEIAADVAFCTECGAKTPSDSAPRTAQTTNEVKRLTRPHIQLRRSPISNRW